MRGLTQYIADLRACRVRELEEKRINKEMAHIRGKFKGESSRNKTLLHPRDSATSARKTREKQLGTLKL